MTQPPFGTLAVPARPTAPSATPTATVPFPSPFATTPFMPPASTPAAPARGAGRRRRPFLAIVVAALASVAPLAAPGCAAKPAPAPAARPVVAVQPPALVRAWKAKLELRDDARVNALHLVDDLLFVYTTANESYVFDRAAGARVHVSRVKGRPKAPVVMKDLIVYPTDNTLEVFARNGRFVRSINLGGTTRTGAAQAAGRVVVGVDQGGRGRALFVDPAKTYADVTPVLTMGGLTARPAARGGLAFVASEDGSVYAMAENLSAAWALQGGTFKTDGSIVADLAADTGSVAGLYVASTDSKLYALAASTGQLRWQYYAGTPLREGPTVTADSVYLTVPGTGLVSIDKAQGESIRKARWSLPDAVKLLAEDADHAYVQGNANRVYGVDRRTGKVRFVSQRDDLRLFATNVRDNIVFAATPTGDVIAATPVLKAGTMGELVMTDPAEATVALAR